MRPAKPLGVLSRHPCRNPKPLPRGEGLCMLCWLCICAIVVVCCRCVLHRLCSTTCMRPCIEPLGIHARRPCRAECGAAALTKQGRLKSVAHSRCTTQRHNRLTTCIGATPQTRFLNCIGLSTVCKLSCFSAFLPLCLSSLFRFLRHILKQ